MFTPEDINRLADVQTPAYYYDLPLLRQNLKSAQTAAQNYGYHIHYAIKANNNERVLKEVQQLGLGADCVSGNEIQKAIESGFAPKDIVFAGVGKTDAEIKLGLHHQILTFNVESVHELQVIAELAQAEQKTAAVALRINPNIDAQTHKYITTGLEENKFGIMPHEFETCLQVIRNNAALKLKGIHFHVGSQITDLSVFKQLAVKVNEWNEWFFQQGFDLEILNLGGGLGVNYTSPDSNQADSFSQFFKVFYEALRLREGQTVHFELGRSLVAGCGNLLSRVLYIKNGLRKKFVILDAGMTELIRPALYQAQHKIECLSNGTPTKKETYDVVGPICESSDCFGKDVELPVLERGGLLAIRSAGAYGEVMASRYNLRQDLHYYYKE